MPLEPLGATQQPSQETPDRPPQSFRERKLQALQSESEPQPGRPEAPYAGSAEDGYPEEESPYQPPLDNESNPETEPPDDEGAASDTDQEELGALQETEEPPAEDAEADADADTDDDPRYWKNKFQAMEKEFRRVTANRKAIEAELSENVENTLSLRHSLEDLNAQAEQRAKFFLDWANQDVARYEQLDWSKIEPEQMAHAKQAYQQAVNQRNIVVQALEQASQAQKDAQELQTQRQAEISRSVLQRTVPNWGDELYGQLRDFSTSLGFTTGEFNEIVDHRLIRLIHTAWESQQAAQKVQQVKETQRARSPRNRNARPQERNARGQYTRARDKFFEQPGDKASFREMKRLQIERERREGVTGR